MGTLKKAKAKFRRKAEDGYKSRQGNYPAEETKPSEDSSIKERQGQTTRDVPNKFPEAKAPEKKAQTFGEAFKAGRASGAKTFTWNGKSYTTRTKEDDDKDNGKSLDMAASMIKARSKQIDGKDLKTPPKLTPGTTKSSTSTIKAALGQPPKKGIAYKSKMKCGGKTKKK